MDVFFENQIKNSKNEKKNNTLHFVFKKCGILKKSVILKKKSVNTKHPSEKLIKSVIFQKKCYFSKNVVF